MADELGRLIDGMDPVHHVTLEEYARDVVLPFYMQRQRPPLRVAIGRLEDKSFLTEAITDAGALPSASPGPPRWSSGVLPSSWERCAA